MRYPGNKSKLAQHIMPFIEEALKVFPNGKYIEPFVGGANMIDKVKHHTRIGYDANKCLIALYKMAKFFPEKLKAVKCLPREAHKLLKNNRDAYLDWYVAMMGLFPTYSSLWFGSYNEDYKKGRFDSGLKSLLKQDLSGIQLINCDYKNIPIGKGNVFYCDPPYKIFDYYKMPFNHEEFYDWVRRVSQDNIVLVSEYEMPDDFTCVWQKVVKPGINAKAALKIEKLFIYKP